jgi:hypothetical protein
MLSPPGTGEDRGQWAVGRFRARARVRVRVTVRVKVKVRE